MSSSDSDEDIHQCGRCKETFVSLENYFNHKKSKSCRKNKAPKLSKVVAFNNGVDISAENEKEAVCAVPSIESSGTNQQEDTIAEKAQDHDTYNNAEIILATEETSNVIQLENNILTSSQSDGDVLTSDQNDKDDLIAEQQNDNHLTRDQPNNKQTTRTRLRSLPRKSKIIADYAKLTKRETNPSKATNSTQGSDKHVPLRKRKLKVDFDTSSEQNTVEKNLLEHVKKCPKPTNFTCSECEFTALYKDEYTAHLYNAHKISDKTCNFCNKPFRYKHRLKQHILSQKCRKRRPNTTKLHDTTTVHTTEGAPKRSKEQQVLEQSADTESHDDNLIIDIDENNIEIEPYSDDSDTTKNENEDMIKMNKLRKPAKKKIMKRSSVSRVKATVKRKKNQKESFACPACVEHFTNYRDIKNHMGKHHPATYCGVCKLCGKYYPTKYKLWRHMTSNLHTGLVSEYDIIEAKADLMKEPIGRRGRLSKSNIMNCVACKISFETKQELHEHVQQHHSNKLNTKCAFCSQVFPTETIHRKHMISVHKIDRENFSTQRCSVCCKTFSHKHHVVRHKSRVHKPQIPYTSNLKSYDPSADVQSEALYQKETVNKNKPKSSDEITAKDLKTDSIDKRNGASSSIMIAHKCFLCGDYFLNNDALNIHLEYHKVWIPSNDDVVIDTVYQSIYNSTEKSIESSTENFPENSIEDIEGIEGSDPSAEDEKHTDVADDEKNKQDNDIASSVEDGLSDTHINSKDMQETTEKSTDEKASEQHENYIFENTSRSNDKSYTCPYCSKPFTDWENFKQHKIVSHDLKQVFKCIKEECFQIFETIDEYKEHNTTHSQGAFICISCNDHFSTLELLMLHRLSFHIHRTNGFKCYGCGEVFPTADERKIHQTKVKHEFQCKKCDRAFKTEANLKSHELFHSNLKHFLCDQCGAGFTNKQALKRHTFTHNPIDNFPCPSCGKVFTKRDHMKRHLITTHITIKPFKCTHTGCTRAYKRKDKLKEHMRTHSEEALFVCQFCSRPFKYKQALQYHEKTHAKDRSRECTQCDALFYSLSDLKQHLVRDHNIKMKSEHHTNVCPKCKLSFTRVERLNRHIEKVHKDYKTEVIWTIKCQICQKGFAGEKSLSTHLEKRHHIRKSTDKEAIQEVKHNEPSVYVVNSVNEADIIIQPNEHDENVDSEVTYNEQDVYKTTDVQQIYGTQVLTHEEAVHTGGVPNLLVLQLEPSATKENCVNDDANIPTKKQYLENIQTYQRQEHISKEAILMREQDIQKEPNISREPMHQGDVHKEPNISRERTHARDQNDLPALRSQLAQYEPGYIVGIPNPHEQRNKEEDKVDLNKHNSAHLQSSQLVKYAPSSENISALIPRSERTLTYTQESSSYLSGIRIPYTTSAAHYTTTVGSYITSEGLNTSKALYSSSPLIYTPNSGIYPTASGLNTTNQGLYLTSLEINTTDSVDSRHSMTKTKRKPNDNSYPPILPVVPPGPTYNISGAQFIPHSRLPPQPTYGYHGSRLLIPEGVSQGSAILKPGNLSNRVLLPKPPNVTQQQSITEHNKSHINDDVSTSEPNSSELSSTELQASSDYVQGYYNLTNQN